jgi:hypothetical protein
LHCARPFYTPQHTAPISSRFETPRKPRGFPSEGDPQSELNPFRKAVKTGDPGAKNRARSPSRWAPGFFPQTLAIARLANSGPTQEPIGWCMCDGPASSTRFETRLKPRRLIPLGKSHTVRIAGVGRFFSRVQYFQVRLVSNFPFDKGLRLRLLSGRDPGSPLEACVCARSARLPIFPGETAWGASSSTGDALTEARRPNPVSQLHVTKSLR